MKISKPTAGARPAKQIEMIDVTPTWRGVLPLLLAAYQDGGFEGHKAAESELQRMADLADEMVKQQKAAHAV